jgi:DNA (cytosine-5)-methyltransferase 3A
MAIKILIGGSPCTYWSIAQTNNRETKAEGMGWELFKNYLIAKEKFKPDFFLYENNKSASQAIKDQIAEEFGVGVDPNVRFTYINSALVSAQNRQRFYVTNFGDIEQPEDRGILLKDILDTGCTDREKAHAVISSAGRTTTREYFDKQQGTMAYEPVRVPEYGNEDKSRPVRASYAYKGSGEGSLLTEAFPDNPNKQVSDYVAEPLTPFVENKLDAIVEKYGYLPEKFCPYNKAEITDKTPTLTTCCGSQTSSSTVMQIEPVGVIPVNETADGKAQCVRATCYKDSLRNLVGNDYDKRSCVAEPIQVGSLPRPNGELSTSQAMRIYSQEGKSITQSAGGGGLGGKTGLYAIQVDEPMRVKEPTKQGYATPCEWDENGTPTKAVSCADGKTYIVYEVKDGQITIKGKQYPIKLVDGYYIIRKLTVRECARLQTMPDDYCKAVSDSQAYKALGNGWTAEVIIHLLNHALKDVSRDEEIVVLSMYDGIATGRYCLDKMGFTNVTYHAYEIDKYPIQVAMDNYPDIIQHGDAFAVREDDWQPPQTRSEWLDTLLGGDL